MNEPKSIDRDATIRGPEPSAPRLAYDRPRVLETAEFENLAMQCARATAIQGCGTMLQSG